LNHYFTKNNHLCHSYQAGDCTLSDLQFTSDDHGIKAALVGNCTKPTAVFPDYPDLVFRAAQFHVHISCEHHIDGKGCDAELHIVHFSTNTDMNDPTTVQAAVIGMMIDKSALEPHDTMDELLDCWSENHNEFVRKCNPDSCDVSSRYLDSNTTCADGAFDAYSLIPEGTGYYHYMGGLTTPPCSQIVRWNLMDTTVKVTLLQWTKLANLILGFGGSVGDDGTCHLEHTVASKTGSTSRVPRPINGRALTHSCNAFISSRMSAKRNHWQSWPLCSKISRALFSFWPIYNIVC